MEFIKNNKIILLVLILALAFVGYKFFYSPSENTAIGTPDSSTMIDPELNSYMSKVKQIDVDDKLFTSTVWTNLIDFSISVPEITPGNNNPFSSSSNTTQSSQNTVSEKPKTIQQGNIKR